MIRYDYFQIGGYDDANAFKEVLKALHAIETIDQKSQKQVYYLSF